MSKQESLKPKKKVLSISAPEIIPAAILKPGKKQTVSKTAEAQHDEIHRFTEVRKSGSSDKFIIEKIKSAGESDMNRESISFYENIIRFIGSSTRQNKNLNFNDYASFVTTKKMIENLEKKEQSKIYGS